MKPSMLLLTTATAAATSAPRRFARVPLPEPLDWMPETSLLLDHVLASHHANYSAYAGGESWAREMLDRCTRDAACTSTFSNSGSFVPRVNDTSGLQIHSLMYRFHPSVKWEQGYPNRNQILGQVRQLWKRYGLQNKTRFNFKVDRVYQDDAGR
ncbi:hypothetical protein HRG_000816 [Hirsutella rhossiliensis]|uniref:Uncharacterized protein n=1 Tax=Hirsutella rhossiliensis TaxID=111463 RepID=A0A9P8N9F6_9HYPO|nr:uncharacterized protein HRG_00816 [Hirsutella rhossiliensis]KAH0968174.1 hypothetical protein HRG_00816 [Hirsutella rhossiliensis]